MFCWKMIWNFYIFYSSFISYYLFNFINAYKGFTVIKEINGTIYIGGMNSLSSYSISNDNQKLKKLKEQHYVWPDNIMNGSAHGLSWSTDSWPDILPSNKGSFSFDSCLNWKDEHPNATVRDFEFDVFRTYYHIPSADFDTMTYSCQNSFIKGIEPLDDDKLWVCGTFGSFPRAFSVNRTNLEFIKFVDNSVMSCARYVDEPMATFIDSTTKELYVASGWGLYRPDKSSPDVPYNNSTMLYSDWRLYRNMFTFISSFAVVLSSDVNFIDVVKETKDHIYFFGYEVNSQYGLNNQDDRNAWQSFMLRICKQDLGFNYSRYYEMEAIDNLETNYYAYVRYGVEDFKLNPSFIDVQYQTIFPTKHFVTPLKINFGCYISKRLQSIADNHFWGETNIVYLNKLVDVVFDPERRIEFITRSIYNLTGCNKYPHSQIPLLGLFNGPGIVDSGVEPIGALCQLQINPNIFVEVGSKKPRYSRHNNMNVTDAFDEIMAISSTITPNFYSETLHRTNGFTLYPYWNQGIMHGISDSFRTSYKNVFTDVGKCHSKKFYEGLTEKSYLKIQNFTNTAWPNQIMYRLTSLGQSTCQFYTAELYNFNASFIVPGVEFKRMFVIEENITNYVMNKIGNENNNDTLYRRYTSPLMIVGIISTSGVFYRVVLCDFDNGMINHGYDKTSGSWYNWCIFRHTNQPYLYRQFTPMDSRERNESGLYRASSLLLLKKVVDASDSSSYPINKDPKFHVVKGVLRKGDYMHVVTTNNIHSVSLKMECSHYSRCIDCASDPLCMWDVKEMICNKYTERTYNDDRFVQDVLDRGFKCLTCVTSEEVKYVNAKEKILTCSNIGFWRGNIIWRNGTQEITNDNNNFVIDNTNLVIINNNLYSSDNISCYGYKDDEDKLYHAQEYEWIFKTKVTKYFPLCHFTTVIEKPSINVLLMICVFLVILVIALIIILVLLLYYYNISKRIIQKKPVIYADSTSGQNTTDTLLPYPEYGLFKKNSNV